MDNAIQQIIQNATGATSMYQLQVVQSLWGGYGSIVRYGLQGATIQTVIVKHVRLPKHKAGGKADVSHNRKIKSYEIESAWYQQWSAKCDADCRIPHCYAIEKIGDDVVMVLEDLDNAGFARRRSAISFKELNACIHWLANLHATFMGEQPKQLWPVGTYWHLETRPEELRLLTDIALKQAAQKIDSLLNESPYQTIVHGDAKLANFCFTKEGNAVAAVDFQYVGGGCGMKDLAYLVDSCLSEKECEQYEQEILKTYFTTLQQALTRKQKNSNFTKLEENWRALYPVAWADFYRFLKGWSPGYGSQHHYADKLCKKVISQLK